MGSASLAAARPPARTVTTIPLQPGGLRGKKELKREQQKSEGTHEVDRSFEKKTLDKFT